MFGILGDQPTELIAVYSAEDLARRLAEVTAADLAELRVAWREGGRDRWVELALLDESAGDFLGMGMRWTCPHGDGIKSWQTGSVKFVLLTLYRDHQHEGRNHDGEVVLTDAEVSALSELSQGHKAGHDSDSDSAEN